MFVAFGQKYLNFMIDTLSNFVPWEPPKSVPKFVPSDPVIYYHVPPIGPNEYRVYYTRSDYPFGAPPAIE